MQEIDQRFVSYKITSRNPKPNIVSIGDGLFITTESYKFSLDIYGVRREYRIPAGFILDLLSSKIDEKTLYSCLPLSNFLLRYLNKLYNKIVSIFIPAKGSYDIAALEHDFLYYIQENKDMADYLFFLRLVDLGQWRWLAWDYYLILKHFGQTSYDLNKDTKNIRIATDRTIDNLWYQGKKIDLPQKTKEIINL